MKAVYLKPARPRFKVFKAYQACKQVYKFKFDLQPGSLTDQVAGEHQPSYKHP